MGTKPGAITETASTSVDGIGDAVGILAQASIRRPQGMGLGLFRHRRQRRLRNTFTHSPAGSSQAGTSAFASDSNPRLCASPGTRAAPWTTRPPRHTSTPGTRSSRRRRRRWIRSVEAVRAMSSVQAFLGARRAVSRTLRSTWQAERPSTSRGPTARAFDRTLQRRSERHGYGCPPTGDHQGHPAWRCSLPDTPGILGRRPAGGRRAAIRSVQRGQATCASSMTRWVTGSRTFSPLSVAVPRNVSTHPTASADSCRPCSAAPPR
jgi:hypothetical protein